MLYDDGEDEKVGNFGDISDKLLVTRPHPPVVSTCFHPTFSSEKRRETELIEVGMAGKVATNRSIGLELNDRPIHRITCNCMTG